jgi:hypothetical protein
MSAATRARTQQPEVEFPRSSRHRSAFDQSVAWNRLRQVKSASAIDPVRSAAAGIPLTGGGSRNDAFGGRADVARAWSGIVAHGPPTFKEATHSPKRRGKR